MPIEQLMEFTGNHLALVAAFFVILALLSWNLLGGAGGKFALDPVDATGLINHEDALVLDVRSMAEYKQGHIINAINIPMNGLKNQLKQIEKHKNKPIIVSCRSGSRSGMACRILKQAGFENVHNLRGGMLAWENASLPVKRNS